MGDTEGEEMVSVEEEEIEEEERESQSLRTITPRWEGGAHRKEQPALLQGGFPGGGGPKAGRA